MYGVGRGGKKRYQLLPYPFTCIEDATTRYEERSSYRYAWQWLRWETMQPHQHASYLCTSKPPSGLHHKMHVRGINFLQSTYGFSASPYPMGTQRISFARWGIKLFRTSLRLKMQNTIILSIALRTPCKAYGFASKMQVQCEALQRRSCSALPHQRSWYPVPFGYGVSTSLMG